MAPVPMNRTPVAASRQSAAGCCSHELRRSAETPLRQGPWPQMRDSGIFEPTPLTPSLSPNGGEGGRRSGEGASLGQRAQGAIKVRGVLSMKIEGADVSPRTLD